MQGGLLGIAGAAIIAVLLRRAGFEATWAAVQAVDPWLFAAAAAVFSLGIPLTGYRWWLALRLMGHQAGLGLIVAANIGTNLANFVLPGHFGEVLSAWWLDRSRAVPGVEAFAALVTCKVVGTMVNLCAALAFAPLLGGTFEDEFTTMWMGLAVAVSLGVLGTAMLFHPGLAQLTKRALTRSVRAVLRLSLRPLRGKVRSEQVSAMAAARVGRSWSKLTDSLTFFARRPGALALIAAISVGKLALWAASLNLLLAALGVTDLLDWPQLAFVSICNLLGMFFAINIPLSLGLQEAIIFGLLDGMGVASSQAMAAGLLHKAVTIVEAAFSALVVLGLLPLLGRSEPSELDE